MSGEQRQGMQKIGLFIAGAGVAVSVLVAARSYADLPERVAKTEARVEVLQREMGEIGERLARIEANIDVIRRHIERNP